MLGHARDRSPFLVKSVCPSKTTYGSNVRPTKPTSAIIARASKPLQRTNVCSRSVSDARPSKTISIRNVCSSNSVRAIDLHPLELVIFVLANVFVEVVFAHLNLFVEMFVKVTIIIHHQVLFFSY